MIRFQCQCGRTLQAREQDIGKPAKCPACNTIQNVPESGEAFTPSAPPPRDDRYRDDDRDDRRRRDDRDDDYRDRDRDRGRDRDDYRDRPRRRDSEPEQVSGKATAAMILGIGAFCLNLLCGAPAIVFGILAMRDIERSKGRLGGRGAALAGVICGALGILLSGALAVLLYPVYARVGESRDRMEASNNLKQIGLALHNYESSYGGLPQAAPFRSRDGKPLLSWRVALLPYLEQDVLYKQFRFDEPWDSANNLRLLGQMPKVYQMPGRETTDGTTYYQALVGPRTAFEVPPGPQGAEFPGMVRRGTRISEFLDGTSNTLLIVTSARSVPWTAPQDITYDPNGPLPELNRHFRAGTLVLMGDGSVRPMKHDVPPLTLRALITRNGGEVVSGDW